MISRYVLCYSVIARSPIFTGRRGNLHKIASQKKCSQRLSLFICFNKIIVELKGVKSIANEHQAQVLNYLKATELKLGLIVNFGAYPKVK